MTGAFVWVFAFFAAGIIAAQYIHVSLWLLAAGMLCAAASLRAQKFRVALAAQLLLIFLLGHRFMTAQEEKYNGNTLHRWVQQHEKDTVRIQGTVVQTPEISEDYYSLRVQITSVAGTRVDGVARLTITGTTASYPVVGDGIETFARFRLPANFGVPGAFDYVRYLRKEGIHALGSVKDPALIHLTGHTFSVQSLLSRIRLHLILGLLQQFPPSDAAILRALWLDDRSGLSKQTEQMLIDAGIFHVIAISGFHVSILLVVLLFLMKRRVRYPYALLISGLFLLSYFLLLEGRSSITRSFLTFLIYAFAFWRHEEAKWTMVLPLSALLQIVFNPGELFDPGYHLTYLATAAICFLAVPLCGMIRLPRKVYRIAVDFLVVSLCIQVVLLPYQAFVFHRIPFSSMLANVIAIPLSSLLILIALILLPAYPLQGFLAPAVCFLVKLFVKWAALFDNFWLAIVSRPSWLVVAAFYAMLLGLLAVRRKMARMLLAAAMLVCLGFILIPGTPKPTGCLRVHFLDVGQGDAILIEYPDGTVDLVDSGGFWNSDALDTGDAVLLPYLTFLRITRIHRVFLTHAHADHMNGLFTLMKYIPVQEFYLSRFPYGDAGFRRLISGVCVSPKGIRAGDIFRQEDVKIEVLAPGDSEHTSHVANDDSLVLLLKYQGKRILLTGDAEIPTENKLSSLPDLRVDYLKVPHHGSKSSSTEMFLERTRPGIAFISVGKNNWFGHPNPEVLKRYRRRHALVYRTDELGTIILTIRDGYGSVSAYAW